MTRPTTVPGQDPDFAALCDLVRELRTIPRTCPQVFHMPVLLGRRLPHLPALLRSVRRLPVVELRVSEDGEGLGIRRALSERRLLWRKSTAASVLALPADPDDYLRGRSKQALRTNRNRALQSGVTVREVEDEGELERRVMDMFRARDEEPVDRLVRRVRPRDGRFWFAVDASDVTLALMVVSQDVEVAWMAWMISADRAGRSDARYLLSAEAYQALARDGVRHVVTDSRLHMVAGVQHFQQLLGFQPANVLVRPLH